MGNQTVNEHYSAIRLAGVKRVLLAVLTTLLALGLSTPLAAQDASGPKPCTADEHGHFDFWLGSWEVRTEDGQVAGTNTVTKDHGGCVLREDWEGLGGGTGESFNIYDPASGTWHQTWVDDQGRLLTLDGGIDSRGRMVLLGERPGKDGLMVTDEITWEPHEDGTVLQIWSVSTDAGTTWRELFRGTYHKKAES